MTQVKGQKTFLDFFPAPEFLLLSTSGISVTDSDTKFAELKRGVFGDGFKLGHSEKFQNPEGAIESGEIKDPAALAENLKKISSKYGVRYAHATLPDEKVYIFTAAIDAVAPEDLHDAAAFIIEEHVPVPLADSVFDFEVVGKNSAARKIKLAVTVAPKSVARSYEELFESAGITPVSFDTESQAVARAVVPQGDRRSHLIVNISAKRTGLYAVEDGVVQFATSLSYGADSDADNLKSEMRKVMEFWNDRTEPLGGEARKIEKVIICGIGADNEDFVAKLVDGLETERGLADVWTNMSRSGAAEDMKLEESIDYASAIGLVLPRQNRKHV